MKRYRAADWLDPRVETGVSRVHGTGSFAAAPIHSGEVVMIWGGIVRTHDQARAGQVMPGTATAIAEDLVIGAPPGAAGPGAGHYLNHACDPNVWMSDEVTLTARREIAAGEELTADYAMWEWNEARVMPWTCACGSPLCRRIISGADWLSPDLQSRYRGHFSPFINARIARHTTSSRCP